MQIKTLKTQYKVIDFIVLNLLFSLGLVYIFGEKVVADVISMVGPHHISDMDNRNKGYSIFLKIMIMAITVAFFLF